MNKPPVKVAIVGAGTRGQFAYAPFSKMKPDLMQLAAVAETNEGRRKRFCKEFDIPPARSFDSAEKFFEHEKLADVVIIATQDKQHYPHALAAIGRGYDILLEKPIAPSIEQCAHIAKAAKDAGRKVVVCHVLRYTMFFQLLKFYLESGRIGSIASINHTEHVCWWHQAHSFVRGNWRNSKESAPMILAKSCHDMDIVRWLVGAPCESVSSYGSTIHFREECAPAGAAKRCLDGCKAKAGCPYDAEKIYVYDTYGSPKAHWASDDPSKEGVYKALREGPYGRCVYYCDNDAVDHQVVNMSFSGGITASFTMCGFTHEFTRDIKVFGTRGDIIGDMQSNKLHITTFGMPTETIDVTSYASDFSGHGGGDNRMLEEFLGYIRGDFPMTNTLTTIETSVESHIMALQAEQSRLHQGKPYEIRQNIG